jgi:uncharacterized repeat protein (TIGR03809 family)
MTDTTLNLRDYQIARWRKLAEQRLAHIDDLFVTGRWRRYFSEKDFLELVRQTKVAVATWRRLDAQPIETSMLPRATAAVGVLAPNVNLEVFLQEPELVSKPPPAPTQEPWAPMRLPSPFEDAVGAMALERVGRL